MRGAGVCALVFGIAASACATGSDAQGGDATRDDDAGGTTDLPGHDASPDLHAQDAARDAGADTVVSPEASSPFDGAVPDDTSPPNGDDASDDVTVLVDASDGSTVATNIAPSGLGYTWQSMTSATANSGRIAAPLVNDGSLSTQANIDSSTGDGTNAWEAAGVLFTTAQAVSSVSFVQGTTGSASAGDGWFEAGFALQFSTDGTTWSPAAWSASPPYAYSSAVSGKTYVFNGAPASGILGVRVAGQVNTAGKSWWASVKEVMVYSP